MKNASRRFLYVIPGIIALNVLLLLYLSNIKISPTGNFSPYLYPALFITLGVQGIILIWRWIEKEKVLIRLDVENEKLKEELEVYWKKVDEATETRRQIIANISHELRTPLNAVLGFTGVLLDEEKDSEKQEMLGIIKHASENLLRIINDLLDVSKLEKGELKLEQKNFNIRELLKQIISEFGPNATEKGLQMDLSISKDIPEMIIGDSFRLEQILANLLSNATKFTIEGCIKVKVIKLKIVSNVGWVLIRFVIEDSGIGIPAEKQKELSTAFSQVDGSYTRNFEGLGIGLSIIYNLVNLMNGEIEVESEIGKGTIFIIDIPFKTQASN